MSHLPPPIASALRTNAPSLWVDYDEFDQPSYRAFVITHDGIDERFESGDVLRDFSQAQRRFIELGARIVSSTFFDFFRDGHAWDLTGDREPSTWTVTKGPQPWRPARVPVSS